MAPTKRPGSLWTGLACLLTLQSQWQPVVAAGGGAGVAEAGDDGLLWGPYRPNLYFGVRPRIPKSLMGGLLWTRVEDYQSVQTSEYSLVLYQ